MKKLANLACLLILGCAHKAPMQTINDMLLSSHQDSPRWGYLVHQENGLSKLSMVVISRLKDDSLCETHLQYQRTPIVDQDAVSEIKTAIDLTDFRIKYREDLYCHSNINGHSEVHVSVIVPESGLPQLLKVLVRTENYPEDGQPVIRVKYCTNPDPHVPYEQALIRMPASWRKVAEDLMDKGRTFFAQARAKIE